MTCSASYHQEMVGPAFVYLCSSQCCQFMGERNEFGENSIWAVPYAVYMSGGISELYDVEFQL